MYFVCISCGKLADDGVLCAPYGWACFDCADKWERVRKELGARSAVDRRETRPNGERESPLRQRRARQKRYKFRKVESAGNGLKRGRRSCSFHLSAKR